MRGEEREILEEQICGAIRGRRVIRFRYGDDLSYREIAPYILYNSTAETLLVGMLGREAPEPHRFDVGRMREITVTDVGFDPDPRFTSEIPEYDDIICTVDRERRTRERP